MFRDILELENVCHLYFAELFLGWPWLDVIMGATVE